MIFTFYVYLTAMSLSGQRRSSVLRSRCSSVDRARPSISTKLCWSAQKSSKRSSSDERKPPALNFQRFSNLGGRKSSIINEKPKETRRLTDKAYQKEGLTNLIEFLENSGMPSHFTVSKLLNMSKKDFEVIFQCLMNYVYPNYVVKHLEEEAPRMLKELNYPFIPNKSSFMYAAKTSYGQLYGVLFFLLDIAKYTTALSQVNIFSTDADDDELHKKKMSLQFITEMFHDKNIPNNDEEVMEVFRTIVEGGYLDAKKSVEEKYLKCDAAAKEAQMRLDTMNLLKSHANSVAKDLESFEEYLKKMKNRYENKQKLNDKMKQEMLEKEALVREEKAALASQQAAYDLQGFDGKKQREFMEKQLTELRKKLEGKKAELKQAQDECWGLQIQFTKLNEEAMTAAEQLVDEFAKAKSAVKSLCQADERMGLQIQIPDFPDTSSQVLMRTLTNSQWLQKTKDQLNKNISQIMNADLELGLKIHELSMRKSELSMNLKNISCEEDKKKTNLKTKEKLEMDRMAFLEKEYDEALSCRKRLEQEVLEAKAEYEEIDTELEFVKKVEKEHNEKMKHLKEDLEKDLIRQKADEERLIQLVEECGEEINEATKKCFNL